VSRLRVSVTTRVSHVQFSSPKNFGHFGCFCGLSAEWALLFCVVEGEVRARITLPRKHHSLQEFKRLAKRVKVNETQIIVKKLKFLRSLSNEPGTSINSAGKSLQDLEAQLVALKVRVVYPEERPTFLTTRRL
jgi:hypothetical protein